MTCDCPIGTCKEFGFTGRRADICAGRVLTPEKCETYRQNWREEIGPLQTPAGPVMLSSESLGEDDDPSCPPPAPPATLPSADSSRLGMNTMANRKFVLLHNRAPGDVVVLTALARDLKLAYPNVEIDVDTSAMDLWRNNPYLTEGLKKKKDKTGIEMIKCQYGDGIREQNSATVHFLSYFHRDFKKQTGLNVPLTLPYPDLHLSEQEKAVAPIEGRYWIVISGGKSDFTAKVWDVRKMQTVSDRIQAELGAGVVQVGGNDKGHWHPPISGALNMIGHTNLRDLLRLLHHSDGIVCGVTGPMHMAAALQKPCVVVAGGREAWWWEAYVNENKGFGPVASGKLKVPHRYLHTIGLLDCCQHRGCWKNKVVKIGEDKSLCKHPVLYPGQPVPLCMDMITPDHVMAAIKSYYSDGTLAPTSTREIKTPVPERIVLPPAPVVVPAPRAAPPARRPVLQLDL